MTLRRVKLMADYSAFPLWFADDTGAGEMDPEDVPIRASTRKALERWAETFDAILNNDDPRNSGFETTDEANAFAEEGARLADRLRKDLGRGWEVDYAPIDPIAYTRAHDP
jgi:hypothetical protein